MNIQEWLDIPANNTGEVLAKEWLSNFLQPAYTKIKTGLNNWLDKNKLTVFWKGTKYICTGASRLGDVWIKLEGSKHFYDHRVNIEELSKWEKHES